MANKFFRQGPVSFPPIVFTMHSRTRNNQFIPPPPKKNFGKAYLPMISFSIPRNGPSYQSVKVFSLENFLLYGISIAHLM